jgi:hypothetical protein
MERTCDDDDNVSNDADADAIVMGMVLVVWVHDGVLIPATEWFLQKVTTQNQMVTPSLATAFAMKHFVD